MTEALLIGVGVLIVAAFIGGFVLGRKSIAPTGAPTPEAANAIAVDSARAADEAAAEAEAKAQAKAKEVLHASDVDVAARVEQLRARGRSGE